VGCQQLALAALLPGNGHGIHLRKLGNPQGLGEENFFPPLGIEFRTLPVLLFRFCQYKYRFISLAVSYYKYNLLLKYQS
jgi:hypothetical protein